MKRFTILSAAAFSSIFVAPMFTPCQKISAEIIYDCEIKSFPSESLKDYVLKFTYIDTSILVSTDSVGGFIKECYSFPSWMDAVKYWYDKNEFNIEIAKRGDIKPFYLDPSAEGTIRVNLPEEEGDDYRIENNLFVDYSSVLYHNGDGVRGYDSFPTFLTMAIIVGNRIKITDFSIGDKSTNVVAALLPGYEMNLSNLKEVSIRRTAINNPIDYMNGSFYDDVSLTFESDTLKMINIYDGEWLTVF